MGIAEGAESWKFSSYRLLTGDTQHDGLFLEGGSSYLRWRLTGDMSYLVSGCESSIESMRINQPFLTSQVYFTDRVFVRGRITCSRCTQVM